MSMLQIQLSRHDTPAMCHTLPANEWRALMSVGRHNGREVGACRTLPGDPLRRRNADFRIPWSGGRTLGDGDRMSEAEVRSLADAIEASAREIVEFLRGTAGGVGVRLLDLEREEELYRAAPAGAATAGD